VVIGAISAVRTIVVCGASATGLTTVTGAIKEAVVGMNSVRVVLVTTVRELLTGSGTYAVL
jgi:lipoate-protein ligase B